MPPSATGLRRCMERNQGEWVTAGCAACVSLSSPLSDAVIQIEAWRQHRSSKILAVVGHHGVLPREELCHRFLLMSAAERLTHSPTCARWPLVPWLETTIVFPSMPSRNYSTHLLKPATGRRFKNTRSHAQICMKENLQKAVSCF